MKIPFYTRGPRLVAHLVGQVTEVLDQIDEAVKQCDAADDQKRKKIESLEVDRLIIQQKAKQARALHTNINKLLQS